MISGQNSLEKLIRSMQKLAKSVIKTSSKIYEPKTYDKSVNNLMNRNKQ